MDAFLQYLLDHLVEDPHGEVSLVRTETAKKITYRLRLPKGEVGKVIGHQGRTIRAIRHLLAAGAAVQGQRAVLLIEE